MAGIQHLYKLGSYPTCLTTHTSPDIAVYLLWMVLLTLTSVSCFFSQLACFALISKNHYSAPPSIIIIDISQALSAVLGETFFVLISLFVNPQTFKINIYMGIMLNFIQISQTLSKENIGEKEHLKITLTRSFTLHFQACCCATIFVTCLKEEDY